MSNTNNSKPSVRELTAQEKQNIQQGLTQVMPELFTSYSTPLYKMLCSPLKNTLLYLVVVVVLFTVFVKVTKGNPRKILTTPMGLLYSAGVVLFLIFKFYGRNMKNQNIIESMKRLPEGATYMDYVSQSAVMSNRLRGGRGGSFSGGILGGLIGSRMGRR